MGGERRAGRRGDGRAVRRRRRARPRRCALPRWLATGLGAARARRPGGGDRRAVPRARRLDRQPRPVGAARQHPVDLVGIAVVVVARRASPSLLAGRLRVEPLARRGDLVVPAALRRHDAGPAHRRAAAPPAARRAPRTPPVVRPAARPARRAADAARSGGAAGAASLRYPVARLVRMAALAVAAGRRRRRRARGTTPAIVGIGVALLPARPRRDRAAVAGDRPPRPHRRRPASTRGWLLARHLAAPAVALVPFAALGAAAVVAVEPGAWAAALALCRPGRAGSGVGGCGRQHRARRPRPAVAADGAVGRRAAGVRRLHVDACGCCSRSSSAPLAGLPVLGVREQPDRGTVVRMVVARRARRRRPPCAGGCRERDEWRGKLGAAFLERRPGRPGACGMTACPATSIGLTKTYGDAPALGAARPRRRRRASGSCSSATTAAARRRCCGWSPACSSRRPGRSTSPATPVGSIEARAATSYLGDQPVFYDDLSVWEHLEYVARLHGTDDWEQHADRAARARSAWPTGATTCRRRSAAACGRRRRSRSRSSGRSRCCSSTSRSSASTEPGATRCSSCSPGPRRRRDARRRHPRADDRRRGRAPRRAPRRRAHLRRRAGDADVDALVAR